MATILGVYFPNRFSGGFYHLELRTPDHSLVKRVSATRHDWKRKYGRLAKLQQKLCR